MSASTLKDYNICNKVTVAFSADMDDGDFAQTINNTIQFNTKVLRNRDITNQVLNADNYLSSTDIRGIAVHEAGHIISRQYGEKGLEIAKKAYYNIYGEEISNKDIAYFLQNNVSEYSVKNTGNRNNKLKEIVPEIMAKNATNSTGFTMECLKLLKELIK